jgi:CheY-like chemotaxis protein
VTTAANAIRAVLVDDSAEDLRLAARLTNAGLPCDPVVPIPDIEELREQLEQYDIVILDFRLDDVATAGERVSYRGGTVAAAIKERTPEVPVALLTTEEKLHKWIDDSPLVKNLFDYRILKSDLASARNRREFAEKLRNLALGFKTITTTIKRSRARDPWTAVQKILDASPSEVNEFARAIGIPPNAPADVARMILREFLEFPGPLLNAGEARAKLGLSAQAFESERVQNWLSHSSYAGVFSRLDRRWWRSRLEVLISSAVVGGSSAPSFDRAKAIAGKVSIRSLSAAECIWCGSALVVRACSLCAETVDGAHCIPTAEPRPLWSEPIMVCFACIENGRADGARFKFGTESLVSAVRAGEASKIP